MRSAAIVGATVTFAPTVRRVDFFVVTVFFFVVFLVTTLTGVRVDLAFAVDGAWPFTDAATARVPTASRTCAADGSADAPRTRLTAARATKDRLRIPMNVTPAEWWINRSIGVRTM